MKNRYVVLGAGRQGVAIAYDLALHADADQILLCDTNSELANSSAVRVNNQVSEEVVLPAEVDVRENDSVIRLLQNTTAVISAVPYHFNVELAKMALEQQVHFADLGGNTGVVREQLALHEQAKVAGISIVPDCGLAPGMANSLARYLIEKIEAEVGIAESISIYCGGLPQDPQPPLKYSPVFSLEGLINEYDFTTHILRDGKVVELEPLEELEEVEPFQNFKYAGKLEAFLTSGGASLAPWQYEGVLDEYVYKTLRYPGHCAQIKLLRDLGLFKSGPRREMLMDALSERLPAGEREDLVLLRVVGRGRSVSSEHSVEVKLELVDKADPETGLTAMERTTGFSAAIVAHMQASGEIAPGAATPDPAVPAGKFVDALHERGFQIEESVRGARRGA